MKVLVTAGPTREFLDPVRFLSNRSSGKMGYAIAAEAEKRGHEVCLVSGPVALPSPRGVRRVPVQSAADMLQGVMEWLPWCDALIMAAAVADWRPRWLSAQKLKKAHTAAVLELERTADILASVALGKQHRLFVGFAAETENLLEEAGRKMREKALDLIVANDVSQSDAGFEVDTNRVTFLTPGGVPQELPLMSKEAVAGHIMTWVEGRKGRVRG